ncbi:hypothetical protein GGI10_000657 [Coemansia sp. RSA 2530]|nr:hypothetical protein GGI10_000657 [Coemansia sp. RSA 2530]
MAAYYIEVLDSLKVVDIYVECARSEPKSGGSDIQLVGTTELRISSDSVISLPVTVLPRAAARSSLADSESGLDAKSWVRIRAPIALDCLKARLEQASQLITSIEKPITADAIQGVSDIGCQSCLSSLLASIPRLPDSDTLKIRDLPSAFWSELVDCWVCHPEKDTVNVNADLLHAFEPEVSEPTTANTIESLETKPSVDMWVGDTYVLATERLFKDVTKMPVHMDKKVLSAISVSLSQVVSREILSHVGAHAVYRFVVEGRKACRPVVLINVVGWNAEIQARAMSSTQTDSLPDISGRCLKILFTQRDTDTFDSQAKQWLDDSATELISLLDADADSLLRILVENSRLLPPPLRGMANMTRSFLQM